LPYRGNAFGFLNLMEAAAPDLFGAIANSRAAIATKTKAGFQKNRICFVNLEIYCLLYARFKNNEKVYLYHEYDYYHHAKYSWRKFGYGVT
jgi:hypothetical protein